jgi:hypothetical protein
MLLSRHPMVKTVVTLFHYLCCSIDVQHGYVCAYINR